MGLAELLDRIRGAYVQQFAETLAKYSDKEVIHEPALCDADGKMVVAGKLSLPTRLDIVVLQSKTPTDTIRVDSNTGVMTRLGGYTQMDLAHDLSDTLLLPLLAVSWL